MNHESIIECVPNFSEGTNREIVARIVASMQVEHVSLLDWSLDAAHNRSVVTLAGPPDAVVEAAVRAVGTAAKWIDLTRQNGVHPRIGAADVVPFVPVHGLSLAECAMLARQAGLQIWRRYGVPVYFYGAAAARPDRVNLEDVRRGQFEGLREVSQKDAARRPDIGGPELHATAGASAVGARSFLIAYNVYLDEPDIAAARAIAREIRSANGGLHGVKAIGVLCDGRAQISMNITDYRITPMPVVHAKVQELAHKHGAHTAEGELIGLIPQDAYDANAVWISEIPGFRAEAKVLEQKLRSPMDWPGAEA
jgi:glutamate formiminotransferase